MYSNLFKFFSRAKFSFKGFKFNPLLSFTFFSLAAFHSKKYLLDDQEGKPQKISLAKQIADIKNQEQMMKKIVQVEVCKSEQIPQGHIYSVLVKNKDGTNYQILITRYKSKLFAISGQCTYREPLQSQNSSVPTLREAAIFNDKLMCPHHGCAFDIKSGTVQFGPATFNLPRFAVRQQRGKVTLFYPQKIPKRVTPKTVTRDFNDLRKVLILGGDDNAQIGCIDGLRQFGFDGQINVIQPGSYDLPYSKDALHKSILNFKLKDKYKTIPTDISKQIDKLLQQKIYSKLKFHPDQWYDQHGIQFTFTDEQYRIIHKRYYPYVTLFDGSKKQYDGLVISTGVYPASEKIRGITCNRDDAALLPDNVFMPFRNKVQHKKMLKFLNTKDVKNMIVLGLDNYTLQFLGSLRKQFPDIKVTVLDFESRLKLYQELGEELTKTIIQQYSSRGMQFYIQIDPKTLTTSNKLQKNLTQKQMNVLLNQTGKIQQVVTPQIPIHNSIELKIGNTKNQQNIYGDCCVYFPSTLLGNTENIRKKGKYTDLDFDKNGLIVTQSNMRTDTFRIFSIGTVSANEFFFNNTRLTTLNPQVHYEQGLVSALNLLALGIPFAYIPVNISNHFGKKLYQAGPSGYFNEMYVMGSIKNWDFLILYSKSGFIYNVAASQSKRKQFQIFREAFRLRCQPLFNGFVEGEWTIQKLHQLIKSLDKSYCYKDQIHAIQEEPILNDLVWVQRSKGAGYANDRPLSQQQTGIQIDERGYVRQL